MADLRKQNGHEKPWKMKFWGVGNENWGCGANEADYNWTEIVMKNAGDRMQGFTIYSRTYSRWDYGRQSGETLPTEPEKHQGYSL
jgi:alpha-N-arabinofuranosidase